MSTRTFRWNDPDETLGYRAAEVDGDVVRWWSWSHVHGEGRRDRGAQRREEVVRDGPPLEVPSIVLAQILEALAASSER